MNTSYPIAAPLIDSHCHLQSLDLQDFDLNIDNVIHSARKNGIEHMLCVCIDLSDLPAIQHLADKYPLISTSVGIHPNVELTQVITAPELIALANHPSCIAIGETGLDYFRTETEKARELQQALFRQHIHAAIETSKPLIIHTREAAEDTLLLMKENRANQIGGVMHCFAEDWDIARRALDLNFYISFSGIVTFKNATKLQEVAKKVPLDRILIETDSPYLAPVPFRGKQNHPALVIHVARMLGELRQLDFNTIAKETTANFYQCFKLNK